MLKPKPVQALVFLASFLNAATADRNYDGQGYPIPNEDDYYQQEPNNNPEPDTSSFSSTKKGKPLPIESSFFLFSAQNR